MTDPRALETQQAGIALLYADPALSSRARARIIDWSALSEPPS